MLYLVTRERVAGNARALVEADDLYYREAADAWMLSRARRHPGARVSCYVMMDHRRCLTTLRRYRTDPLYGEALLAEAARLSHQMLPVPKDHGPVAVRRDGTPGFVAFSW